MSNYTKLPIQMATAVVMAREREAFWEQLRTSESSTDDRRKLVQTNGYELTDTVEAIANADAVNELDAEVADAAAIWQSWKDNHLDDTESGFASVLVDFLDPDDDELAHGMIEYDYLDVGGAISISRRRGLLGALYHDMVTNGQKITANGVSIGAITAKEWTVGALTKTSASGESHALSGTLNVECIDESVSKPQFRVTLKLDAPLVDLGYNLEGDRKLTAEKSWQDGWTGVSLLLTRSGLTAPVETGDDDDIFSSTTFTTPKTGDCDDGVFYFSITRQDAAPIWLIEVFNSDTRRESEKVGYQTTTGTVGTDTITIECANGTIIETTVDLANADGALMVAGDADVDIEFDIQTPRLGDVWTMSVTNDGAGKYATKIARVWRATLPTTGATLWTDANANSQSIS